jgi:hypothetical protein
VELISEARKSMNKLAIRKISKRDEERCFGCELRQIRKENASDT